MGKCYNFESIAEVHKYDVVRKIVHWHASDRRIVHGWHTTSDLRERLDQLQRVSNLGYESFRNALITIPIPRGGVAVFILGWLCDV